MKTSDVVGTCVLRIGIMSSTTVKVMMTPAMSTEEDTTVMTNVPMQASGVAVIQTHHSQV